MLVPLDMKIWAAGPMAGPDDDDDARNGGGGGTGVATKTKPKTKKPSMYRVLLLGPVSACSLAQFFVVTAMRMAMA